jgi:hypothetical protein
MMINNENTTYRRRKTARKYKQSVLYCMLAALSACTMPTDPDTLL